MISPEDPRHSPERHRFSDGIPKQDGKMLDSEIWENESRDH